MIVGVPASGAGPRRGFISIARAAWVPVGANATKPPICAPRRLPRRSAGHEETPTKLSKCRGI